MTPRWVEAFGNVAIEALACGVPVIAYHRGGPAEIVEDGKSGFLVEPDSVEGLVDALGKLDTIDRHACRQRVEVEYSNQAMGDRMEQWFWDICSQENRRLGRFPIRHLNRCNKFGSGVSSPRISSQRQTEMRVREDRSKGKRMNLTWGRNKSFELVQAIFIRIRDSPRERMQII
jgi:hypothetical protein